MDSPVSVAYFVEVPAEGLEIPTTTTVRDENDINNCSVVEDDENSVADSVDTLFSELSDDEDEDKEDEFTKLDPYVALLKSFAERNRLLKKITRGKSPEYVRILQENEKEVQDEAMRLFRRKQQAQARMMKRNDENSSSSSSGGVVTPTTKKYHNKTTKEEAAKEQQKPPAAVTQQPGGLLINLRRVLLLEFHHSLQGYAILCLYCLIHLSLYALVADLIQFITWETTTDAADDWIYCICLGLGLALCRAGGTIWNHYVNHDTYRAIKFDAHNRLRRGDSDARLLRWFRKHPNMAAAVDLLGFYMVLVSMYNLQEQLLYQFDIRQSLLESLPSRAACDNVVTLVRERLSVGLQLMPSAAADDYDDVGSNDNDDENMLLWLDAHQNWTNADEVYLESKLSGTSFFQLMGNEDAVVVDATTSILFYLCCAIVPAFLMSYKWNYHFDAH